VRNILTPTFTLLLLSLLTLYAEAASPNAWGLRPEAGSTVECSPPSFTWPSQWGMGDWELQVFKQEQMDENQEQLGSPVYQKKGLRFTVHRPSTALPPGDYLWRYRGTKLEKVRDWSAWRKFTVPQNVAFTWAMPPEKELLARIPQQHPRLFLRPEDLPRLRKKFVTEKDPHFANLVKKCDQMLKGPPKVTEPEKYPPGCKSGSELWRKIWWGNRTKTQQTLAPAAMLGFVYQITGEKEYGELAKKILLAAAEWDPHGATGYRYNDEAGMPFVYYFARTYTNVHDLLTTAERQKCCEVAKARGGEMYKHLFPRHLDSPYASHSNRAWHFLGELGVAFYGEIPEAENWTLLALNVFYNVYPVWSDNDGGWHEGYGYWRSYLGRFFWWADVMRATFRVNAFENPYFSRIGYYPIYLMPPGKVGGGFGDRNAFQTSASCRELMSLCAAQSGNGHWQGYVEALGGPIFPSDYTGLLRRAELPPVQAKPLTDLPTSRLFRGTGQAYLNTSLTDAKNSVQVVFKSSPFGTQSHGYEANNSFLLWAYGQRLLIRSGYRDGYGSAHHSGWMWSTRSTNSVRPAGIDQHKRSHKAKGKIFLFTTGEELDVVAGDAADAYATPLQRADRYLFLVKPEGVVLVVDRLASEKKQPFEYWLHSLKKMEVDEATSLVTVTAGRDAGEVQCPILFLTPSKLAFTQTNEYDPNPVARVKLREWHLNATSAPANQQDFVTVMCPQGGEQGKSNAGKNDAWKKATCTTDKAGKMTVCVPLAEGRELVVEFAGNVRNEKPQFQLRTK